MSYVDLVDDPWAMVRHSYDLADYGLTPEAVDAAFARYRDFIAGRGILA